jgi:hypothetical protein
MTVPAGQDAPTTSRMQDAVRLLLLIAGATEDLPAGQDVPAGSVGIFRTQVALQKMDSWLRNPDYLAEFLLDTPKRVGIDLDPQKSGMDAGMPWA